MRKILRNQKGQGLAEYALILALIAVVVAAVIPQVGTAISDTFASIAATLTGDGGGDPAAL